MYVRACSCAVCAHGLWRLCTCMSTSLSGVRLCGPWVLCVRVCVRWGPVVYKVGPPGEGGEGRGLWQKTHTYSGGRSSEGRGGPRKSARRGPAVGRTGNRRTSVLVW